MGVWTFIKKKTGGLRFKLKLQGYAPPLSQFSDYLLISLLGIRLTGVVEYFSLFHSSKFHKTLRNWAFAPLCIAQHLPAITSDYDDFALSGADSFFRSNLRGNYLSLSTLY